METPVQVDFRGLQPSQHIRSAIDKHIGEFERRFGRVTACRIVLTAPSGHHRTGGLYEVAIHLTLPDGREVAIDRTASTDERHADIEFAVNDAFKRARRQLQDQVRRMQGHVKMHDERPIGTIK
jgi:ribosome-associated translation inhibitor RaiA